MRRKVTFRPGRTVSILGGVVGVIFVLIGIFVAIPAVGPFGIFWTAVAAVIAAVNFYQAFGKGYIGPKIEIEDVSEGSEGSAEARLRELQSLYDQHLITSDEYEEKRKEILNKL